MSIQQNIDFSSSDDNIDAVAVTEQGQYRHVAEFKYLDSGIEQREKFIIKKGRLGFIETTWERFDLNEDESHEEFVRTACEDKELLIEVAKKELEE